MQNIPSPETLHQRMNKAAEASCWIINFCTFEFIKKVKDKLSTLPSGHMPLDMDVFTQDNSKTKKEGVSWTYCKFNGFAPIAAWLALEGWCLEIEQQRPGSQHSQGGFIPLLLRAINKAPLLVRLDSAHDAIVTLATLIAEEVDFIVKWNPRRADIPTRVSEVFAHGKMVKQYNKGRVAIMTVTVEHIYKNENDEEKSIKLRRVLPATQRNFAKDCTPLLIPDVEIEG
ncbi:MAG: hypothetical protein PF483_06425 [Halothiobacillus sp.]|nr:hypothetical protein [Halothiobacillus sp.]